MDAKLKAFLDRKVEEYNQPSFIPADPISIPHRFTKLQDKEISGFFAAIFAWGNRRIIINKTTELMQLMDDAPYQFILHHTDNDLKKLLAFKHRTFNTTDLLYCIYFFHHHYTTNTSLEQAFFPNKSINSVEAGLNHFHHYFFSLPDAPERTQKHIAAPFKKSTCKRLNMYLRWMVRKDNKGVDFGIWNHISPKELICPIDVHVARVARKLALIQRPVTDWQTALELTNHLRQMDPHDPAKYDFALFGLGVTEKF
ncbi:TIGR02757 family protein [Flavisolibacter tropicus]|uniref:TIGR02757 family protein n=1 Tax=Flavisolibacter tropicus TaxID=1492898 RepID=A0A172TWS5_9BACT|nr:TIGR02757 family protein [Flavisolibacter tropicus]ANE51187.1 hypothetical protein SY85_12420 [Flavisolibacter tropicus]